MLGDVSMGIGRCDYDADESIQDRKAQYARNNLLGS